MRYSAIIPSKNEEILEFCVRNLIRHSRYLYEIVVIWDGDDLEYKKICDNLQLEFGDKVALWIIQNSSKLDVYGMFNYGVSFSRNDNDHVLLINDDMYVPPEWDILLKYISEAYNTEKMVITFDVVEPGYVDVNERNIKREFGTELKLFKESEFNEFARSQSDELHFWINKIGWYMPVIFPKNLFNESGQYPTYPSFPFPNDIVLFDKLKQDDSIQFIKINKKVYHFQRLSQREKSIDDIEIIDCDKLNLCCGDDVKEGYINIDKGKPDEFDISDGKLTFPDNTFSEILFKHALEHFRFEIGRKILGEIYRILKPEGFVDIYCPDLSLACSDYLSGINSFSNCASAIERLYGQNTNEELVHKAGYTSETLTEVLYDLKFSKVEVLACNNLDEFRLRAWR